MKRFLQNVSVVLTAPILFGAALGFFATLVQIVLLREYLVIRGVSELSLGILLGIWFCGISIGAFVGRILPISSKRLLLIALAFLFCIPSAVLVIRLYELWLPIPPGGIVETPVMVLLALVGALPCAGTVGFLFSVASSFWKKEQVKSVTLLYASEGVGAAIAGVLFQFALIEYMESIGVLLLSLTVLFAAIPLICGGTERNAAHVLFVCTTAVWLFALYFHVDDFSFRTAFQYQKERGTYVKCVEGHSNRICVGKNNGQFQVYSGGTLQYVFPDKYERPQPVYLGLSLHPSPRNVLLIGGGIPDRQVALKAFSVKEIFFFDTDEKMFTAVQPFFDFNTREALHQFNIHVAFGSVRSFLQRHESKFHVIIDFAAPVLTAADHSNHTDNYFKHIRNALQSNGVYIQVTTGSANVFSPPAAELLANEQSTLRSVFSYVRLLSGVQAYWVASMESLDLSPASVQQRLDQLTTDKAPFINANDLFNIQRNRHAQSVLSATAGRVNHDEQPDGFVHSLRLRRLANAAGLISPSDVNLISVRVIVLISLIIWVLWCILVAGLRRVLPSSTVHGVMSIATTGMCAMGLEIVLLYLFSVQWGGLYYQIAGILAAFMVGISIGAVVGRSLISSRLGAPIVDGLMMVLLMGTAFVFWVSDVPAGVFALFVGLVGIVTGAAFPVYLQQIATTSTMEAPWRIEAADHLGAATGAVAVSLLWLPRLGITWTCVLLFLFKVPLIIKRP